MEDCLLRLARYQLRRLMMEFCPKCGTRLQPKKEEGKTFLWCRKCGYKQGYGEKQDQTATTKKTESLVVIPQDKDIRTLPTIRTICPKCGNDTAYVWQVQTRGGDEASTQFFRCTKCGNTTREYS